MKKLTKNLKGKVKLALPVLLIAGILIGILFINFAQSTGESYNLTVFYNGTSIPIGWTCISCNPGDPYYDYYPMINSSAGVSGGNNYNNHTGTTISGSRASNDFVQGYLYPGALVSEPGYAHVHNYYNFKISNSSLEPEYSSIKLISYNNGIPATLPAESLILYKNINDLPPGSIVYSTSQDRYIKSSGSITSGGNINHTHSVNLSVNIGLDWNESDELMAPQLAATDIHTHSYSLQNLSYNKNDPSYASFVLGYTPVDISLPNKMVGLFLSNPGTNWNKLNSTYNNRLIKINNTQQSINLAGNLTHNHGGINQVVTGSAVGSVLISFWGNGVDYFPRSNHTHTINISVTNISSFPAYKTIILAEYSQPIAPPQIQFVSPTLPNATIQGEDYVEINITVITNISQSNVSVIKLDWDGSNQTLYPHLPPICTQSGNTWNCFVNKTGLAADTYCYQAFTNDTFGQWNATERRCITTGFSSVVIDLFYPSDGTGTVDSNNSYHCGATSFVPMDNLTLFIWNSTNNLVYNFTVSGAFSYYLNLTDWYNFAEEDQYHWNCFGVDSNGNSSWHGNNHSILYQIQFVMVTNETYNPETLESGNEPYYITLYRFDPLTNVVPEFYFDDALENGTIWSSQNGNYITFRYIKPLDFINPLAENHSFYWSFWYFQGGIPENLNSTNHTQTIYRMVLQNNNSGGAVPTLETRCIDEMSLNYINCSITDIIDTWPQTSYGEENRQRSFYFSFNNNNSNYTLFRLPDGVANFHTDTEYIATAPGYQQRTSSYNNYVLNNTQRNQSIYLLDTNSGIYVSFLVVNQMYTPLTYVDIKAEKRIMGIWVPIINGQTDESGIWTAFLDPTNMHRFTFNKSGYAIKVLSIYPTQSSYTVILLTEGQGSGTLPPNYMEGINITTYPNDAALDPGEDYNFTMNITSKYWKLDSYGFNLVDDNHTILATVSDYQENGSEITVTYSCSNQTYVHMDYFFYINNSCVNLTRSWWVMTEYEGNYSIKYLFNDVQSLVGTSGLNYFTLLLIAFAITLMLTAALAYVTGLYSPMALMGLITAFTWFWWFIGVIPRDINGLGGAGIIAPVLITFLFVGYAVYENVR